MTKLRAAGATDVGMVRTNRFLVDTLVSCEGDRHESDPPWGIFGGHEGLNASLTKNLGEADEEAWPAKITGFRLLAGDTLEIKVPNSGGYGDPLTRNAELVLSDVLDEFTTLELARRDYGVVIDRQTMTVDGPATLRLRDPQMHIILTGRDAPQALIDYADLVTEMREIKHPYKTQGILAQKGIEF